MTPGRSRLSATNQATLALTAGVITCQVPLGPKNGAKANWAIDCLLWQGPDAKIGKAPIPRLQVYLDGTDPGSSQLNAYDGSFGQASGSLTIARGSQLIAVFTGGTVGDVMHFTVTGEQW
jgi:hypothetical protein